MQSGLRKYTYVVTVKYGKENQAIRELGDALFPYDEGVEVRKTRFRGVLKLVTALEFNQLIRLLSSFPPASVERVVKVSACCDLSEVGEYLIRVLRKLAEGGFGELRYGRKGSLSSELKERIWNELRSAFKENSDRVIHVEPLNGEVCVGLMRKDEDKFYLIRERKLPRI